MTAGREVLREVVAKAARDPLRYHDLTLTYERGHDLSGTTRIELRADGGYTLATQDRYGERAESQGTLDAEQREAVLSAVEGGLLDVPSSTRNLGDDEQPILVGLRYDDSEHRLRIWAGDADANPDFQRFESTLRAAVH